VCENASKHVFKHSRRSKISFLKKVSGGLEVCANASKPSKPLHILKNIFFKDMILVVWKYA
jgi:hypothetical protein